MKERLGEVLRLLMALAVLWGAVLQGTGRYFWAVAAVWIATFILSATRAHLAALVLVLGIWPFGKAILAPGIFWASVGGSNVAACAPSDVDPLGGYYTVERAAECADEAGDRVWIKPGTYTGANARINTASNGNIPSTGLKSGSSTSVHTIIEGVPGLAKPVLQVPNCITFQDANTTTRRDHITIRHLICNGTGGTNTGGGEIEPEGIDILIDDVEIYNACRHGVAAFMQAGTTNISGLHITNSVIRDTNRCAPENGGSSQSNGYGLYNGGGADAVVDHTEFYHVTAAVQFTSSTVGMNVPSPTFAYNYVHDLQKSLSSGGNLSCWGVVFEGPNGKVHHNYFDMTGCGLGAGAYTIGPNADNAQFYNNLVYNNAPAAGIQIGADAGTNGLTGVVIANNVLLNNGTAINELNNTATKSNNRTSGTITDFFASTSNPVQIAGSATINAGTASPSAALTIVGNGNPDQGPAEVFSIANEPTMDNDTANGTVFIDVPFTMNLHTPLQVVNQLGWTVGCTGTDCGTPVVSSVILSPGSDSILRVFVTGIGGTGFCNAATQQYTISFNSATGTITDSAKIGGTINQPLLSFSNQAVNETCTGAGTTPPDTGLVIHYSFSDGAGTTVTDLEGGDDPGSFSGSPSWVSPRGVSFDSGVNEYVDTGFGSGVNPTTQAMTHCLGLQWHDITAAQKIAIGPSNGTSQRWYIGQIGGFYAIGIQGNPFTTGGDFAISASKSYVCLRNDPAGVVDTANLARLFVNGVKGTGAQSAKSYTSFTFSTDFRIGQGTFDVNYGGVTVDEYKYFNEALTDQEIADLAAAYNPPPAPSVGTYALAAARAFNPQLKGGAVEYLAALNTAVDVRPNSYLGVAFQYDGDGAGIEAAAFRMHYKYQCSGDLLQLSDAFGSHQIRFLGQERSGTNIVSSPLGAVLTGVKDFILGGIVRTSAAVPVTGFTNGSSTVVMYLMQIGSATPVTDYFCLVPKNQNGSDIDSLTPSGGFRVNIVRSNGSGT
jgi:hypothetical protein